MAYSNFLLLLINIIINVKSDTNSCPRVRKAWHLISQDERELFIKAYHIINDQGKLKHFGDTHHHILDSAQAHQTAEFFAWHRYFLWEVYYIYPCTKHYIFTKNTL